MPEPEATGWAYAAGFVDGEGCIAVTRGFVPSRNKYGMIDVLKLSRYTLGRKQLPEEWLQLQEHHYWRQREPNHRGERPCVQKSMHSPRRINRQRRMD